MKANRPKTIKSSNRPAKSRKPGRLPIYEALLALNQQFEQILGTLDRLEQLGVFRKRLVREFVKTSRVTVEETRAWANFELTYALQEAEERDWICFGRQRRQLEGTNDVLAETKGVSKRRRQQRREAPSRG